jgi:hypothetical protein
MHIKKIMYNITAHKGNTAILTTLVALPGNHIVDEGSSKRFVRGNVLKETSQKLV